MHPELSRAARLAALALALAACGGGEDFSSTSAKARVRPKNGDVWGRDMAAGLGLQVWELCAELGEHDCLGEAHRVTVGGVEPTVLGIDEPLSEPSVSAPIAYDRVAISACALRYERDAAGAPVLFGPVIARFDTKSRDAVAAGLIERLLGRRSTKAEVEALTSLHDALADVSADPARDWAVGACLTVATSTEALFY